MNYASLKKCPGCNGPIFKFVNVSNNTFHVECGYTSTTFIDTTINGLLCKNVQIPAKKVPCGYKQEFDSILNCYDESTEYDERLPLPTTNIIGTMKVNMKTIDDVYESEDEEECEEDDYGYDIDNCEDEEDLIEDQSEDESEDEDDLADDLACVK